MSKNFKDLNFKQVITCDDQVTFGKYVGSTWLDVVAVNPWYILWAISSTEYVFHYDLIVAAIKAHTIEIKYKRMIREQTKLLKEDMTLINPDIGWDHVPF
jgi:hypothetical protein